MSATTLVRTPWQFGDRSVKEDIKTGVVLPKLKVEHPMSRLGDPDELKLCGTSRNESRVSEKHGSTRYDTLQRTTKYGNVTQHTSIFGGPLE